MSKLLNGNNISGSIVGVIKGDLRSLVHTGRNINDAVNLGKAKDTRLEVFRVLGTLGPVQNNHLFMRNMYYSYYYSKSRYPFIGYLEPLATRMTRETLNHRVGTEIV